MRKLVLLCTTVAFMACGSLAVARDLNWSTLQSTWNERQAAVVKKKVADEKAAAAAKAQGKVVAAEKKEKKKKKQ